MPDINETIVRHFFELNGFLVRTNVKYWVSGARGGGDSDIDLVVYNLDPDRRHLSQDFVLTLDSLQCVRRAVVETKGWHTMSFTEGLVKSTPRIFNFVRPEAIEAAAEVFQDADFRRILAISKLSPIEDNRARTIELLKAGGIEHVIEFPTIFHYIAMRVEKNKNYPDSEIMQTMRLVKIYGMGDEGDGTE